MLKWCSITIGVFLLSSFLEIVCCDVICVPLHSVSWKFLFRGAPFLWCMWSIIGHCQGCGQYEGPNIRDAPTVQTRIRQTAPPRRSGRRHMGRLDDPPTLAAFANPSRLEGRPRLPHKASNLTGNRKAEDWEWSSWGISLEPTTWRPGDWTAICNWVYVTAHVTKWENLSPKTCCKTRQFYGRAFLLERGETRLCQVRTGICRGYRRANPS